MTHKPNETNTNDLMFPEDDPRITAYALGELSNEEATNLESELSANPEWQKTVTSVKETAGLLKQALAEEPIVGLTQAHRDRIESKIAETEASELATAQPLTAGQRFAWIGVGVAASLFLLFSVAIPVLTDPSDMMDVCSTAQNHDSRDIAVAAAQEESRRRLAALGYSGQDDRREGDGGADDSVITNGLIDGQQGWRASQDADVSGGTGVVGADWAKADLDASSFIVTDNRAPTINMNKVRGLWVRALDDSNNFNAADYKGVTDIPYNNVDDDLALNEFPNLVDLHVIKGDGSDDFTVDSEVAFDALYFDNMDGKNPGGVALVASENRDATSANGLDVFFGDGYASFDSGPIGNISLSNTLELSGALFQGFDPSNQNGNRVQAGWWHFVDADGDGNPDAVYPRESSTEHYAPIRENPFKAVAREPLSTFSIDVDTASYANARRFLNSGQLPPRYAVRIEEFINYFAYDYPQPSIDEPFSINVDVADCPWNRNHRLARIGLQGYEIPNDERPESNLVFLIDVSGSMDQPNKLPLLKQSMTMLVDQLDEYDRVAIVVYAGASGLVLDSITCDHRGTILDAIDRLQPGGGTNGAAGIELAYQIAADNFIKDGTNRVILATDGDFNVGVTSEDDLHRLIEEKAKTGVFLSVLGFGGGNYQDATLELLADKGNGNYAYIDTLREAEKVLVEQMGGTLVTIAKDVKIQVEFNPAIAAAYRLIGYENRMLAKEDFNDDTKDAGEIGAGHTVTALYEIVPAGEQSELPDVDPLKYQLANPSPELIDNDELMTVKVRYKLPDEDTSTKLEHPVLDEGRSIDEASDDFRFAAAVASFGMILRNSNHRGDVAFDQILELAENATGTDRSTDREGFIELVEKARNLMQPIDTTEDVDQ